MYDVMRGHHSGTPIGNGNVRHHNTTQPLIKWLNSTAKQVRYTNDPAAGDYLESLKRWWDLLEEIGFLPFYLIVLLFIRPLCLRKEEVSN